MALLGYSIPVYNESTDFHSLLLRWKAHVYTGFGPDLPEIESDCFLVCRDSEDVPALTPNFGGSTLVKFGDGNNKHVSVEYKGVEFNFGPSDDEGFMIVLKIPLLKS